MPATLSQLARHCQCTLHGDGDLTIDSVAEVGAAGPHHLVFIADQKYLPQLSSSRAGAVILRPADRAAASFSGAILESPNPRLAFSLAADLLHPVHRPAPGIHASAVVDGTAHVDATASIGAGAVIEAGAQVQAGTVIGAQCYIGRDVVVGRDTRLHPRVTLLDRCVIGDRCLLHSGVVIGADGFGFAKDGDGWIKTPQIGRVVIGDDVEIGANTTIDRGALGDTVIARGVKLDNLIQIAHNVQIGDNTAIAACVGIAGSTRIGKRCTIAGQVGIIGHLEIVDDVHITADSLVTHSIHEAGAWSSGAPLEPHARWLKNAVRMRHLDEMARQIKRLEQTISRLSDEKGES